MSKLKVKLMLSEKGYSDLKKAITACTITNIALLLPSMVACLLFWELLKPFTGEAISWGSLWKLLGLGVVAAILVFLAAKNDYRKTYIASYKEASTTRLRIAEHLRKLPMSFFNTKDLSDITTNMMADCSTCICLAFFDWRMALAIFCTMPVTFLIIWCGRKLQLRLFDKQVDVKLEASSQIQEYLEGIKIIKSCGLGGSRFSTLDKALQAMRKIAIKVELASGILVQGASLILQAGLGITIFIGTVLITGGEIELLPLLVLLMFSTQIYGPILAILSQLTSLFHLGTVTNRMRTLLTTPAMEGEDKDVSKYDIELKNVTFGYNRDDVIKDVSFSIPAGSITALVGPSGSGKSTISKLIARFWDVRKGQITIGGIDVRTIEPEHLMRCMSFVFQDVTLFNDTVFNNIRVGNMNATKEQVMAAAKAAYCDEFIQRLPDGYQTVLGENGSTLSGGERQRITASLDPENEVLIQRAIAKLVEGKTVIMIAHRLRTVVDADQIIVLEDGKLAELGPHEELMKKKGLYEKLYHIQQESLGWAI
ncbi:MAG: ABC transporter ATP-binding protein [Ruminococcus sp.]|nr:ABC transporter ATP-binding protein [Ruminococcus sp.]